MLNAENVTLSLVDLEDAANWTPENKAAIANALRYSYDDLFSGVYDVFLTTTVATVLANPRSTGKYLVPFFDGEYRTAKISAGAGLNRRNES
jgi:hypothetical protein